MIVAGSGYWIWDDFNKTKTQHDFRIQVHDEAHAQRTSTVKTVHSNEITSDPVIYYSKVKFALGNTFDGPVALRNLSIGERVGILEESVGPEKRYHRARSFQKQSPMVPLMEGWYPSELLEKETST
jgi:hypothetical protein